MLCSFCGLLINKGEFKKWEGYIGHKMCIQKRKERRKRLGIKPERLVSVSFRLENEVHTNECCHGRVIRKEIGYNSDY